MRETFNEKIVPKLADKRLFTPHWTQNTCFILIVPIWSDLCHAVTAMSGKNFCKIMKWVVSLSFRPPYLYFLLLVLHTLGFAGNFIVKIAI